MKRNLIIVIVGAMFLVLGGALTGLCGEAEDARSSLIYGAFVDNYVQKCEAKAEMLDSGSFNIRRSAMQATVKGAFIQSNRDSMIKYLKENNVPLNVHRIQYHLNQKFAQSVYHQNVYAALLEEQAAQ
jgi:hypothetical protein